jgi:acyl-coenzyme A thioesterase PaaI-like protein
MKTKTLFRLMRIWPPYLGAGVRVTEASLDLRHVKVEMPLRFWNKNYVGTQFGGSLYSMVDPFYALMLMKNLGRDYIVWDKAASIRFKRPGKGKVHATFELTEEKIQEIKSTADCEPKAEPVFEVLILDQEGKLVARIEKTLYVARKATASAAL